MASVLTHALREAVRAARLEAGHEDQWFNIRTYFAMLPVYYFLCLFINPELWSYP